MIKGENVMAGYWKNPESTAKTVVDGWLHTGDLGVIDENGYVTMYSSLDADVTVSAGDKVELGQHIGYVGSSALLETAIGDHVHFCVTQNDSSVDPADFFELS